MLDRLRKSQADPALEAAKENEVTRDILEETIETADRASDLSDAARDILKQLGQVLNQVPDSPRFDKAEARGKIDQARGDLRVNISAKARSIGSSADSELSKPNQSQKRTGKLFTKAKEKEQESLAALAAIEKQTVTQGRGLFALAADRKGALPLWSEVVRIGDEAYNERVEGTEEANERVTKLSASTKEKASTVWGYFNNLFDAFGIIAASVAALAAITAVSIVVAVTGYVLGAIAMVAGIWFSEMTRDKEKRLAALKGKLEEGQVSEELVDIADYASKQKRKKKNRQRLVAAAGFTVAVLALIGLAGGPVGIAMAALAASIGLGFIAYKAWREWRGKKKAMQELVKGAATGDHEKVAALKKLGVSDNEVNGLGNKATRRTVESKVEQALKDKRVNTANQLVGYLRSGKPSEKLSAEKIISGLGLDVQKAADPQRWSEEKAVSKVASKLGSW